jgi:hypothetical protein
MEFWMAYLFDSAATVYHSALYYLHMRFWYYAKVHMSNLHSQANSRGGQQLVYLEESNYQIISNVCKIQFKFRDVTFEFLHCHAFMHVCNHSSTALPVYALPVELTAFTFLIHGVNVTFMLFQFAFFVERFFLGDIIFYRKSNEYWKFESKVRSSLSTSVIFVN